jgi:hypothetical protein
MMAPIAGTQDASMVTRHRRFSHFAAIHEKTNAESVDMTPVGIFSKDVLTGEKPRLLIMIPLKVVSPPLGMLMAMLKRKRIHVLGSMTASNAWSHFHCRFVIPVLFSARRWMAWYFSRSVRKKAFMGESGRKMKAMNDQIAETEPINGHD